MTLRQVVLDQRRLAAMINVGLAIQESIKTSVVEDSLYGLLAHKVEAMVLVERLLGDTAEATITFPSSWWQHYKRDQLYQALHKDRLMRWIAQRWPVRHTTHRVTLRFDRYALFPHANIVTPELGRPVIVEEFGAEDWRVDP